MQQPTAPLATLVRNLCNHHPLDEDDRAALLALPHELRAMAAGQYVVREGDRPTHSCVVADGFAIRHKVVGRKGTRQILNLHIPGDMVDLQNSLLRIADHNVQTLTRTSAAFIPREAVVDLAFARPEIGKALWMETLIEASITRAWAANVGRRDARAQLAHLLCEFAYRLDAVGLGESCTYRLPMTHEQIADCVGMTVVHVSRVLKALAEDGLIERANRSVTIADLDRLRKVADFRPLYLHLPTNGGKAG